MRLIASVPGYHRGANLNKWGHMKLRSVLGNCIFDKEFCKSPLIYQVTTVCFILLLFHCTFWCMYVVRFILYILFKDLLHMQKYVDVEQFLLFFCSVRFFLDTR